MERQPNTRLRIGEWCVNPDAGQVLRNGETVRVEARTMRLLVCLAERAGQIVSSDDLLSQVWPDVIVAQDSVYQAVTSLRRILGDDPKQPAYIETVPRLGYRMVAAVRPWTDQPTSKWNDSQASTSELRPAEPVPPPKRRSAASRSVVAFAAIALLCGALRISLILYSKFTHAGHPSANAVVSLSSRSIAVLPFLDLTEGMKEEEFADGTTEELIGKLAKIPGLKVPPPSSSFYFKGKQIPIADVAKTLGVVYLLDGSVRKSGDRVRVAARLIRADTGFVMWSENYDRRLDDILMVQDDIAGEVTKALKASIDSQGAS